MTPERKKFLAMVEAGRGEFERCFAAICYESAVYADELANETPGTEVVTLIRRAAKYAETLRRMNGRPRPPHYGILTHIEERAAERRAAEAER